MTEPRVSIVIPAYNEGEHIVPVLDHIIEAVNIPAEVLVVFDTEGDTTRPVVERYHKAHPNVIATHNTLGRGPAKAIRFGIHAAKSPVVVVTMADGSDDPQQIVPLTRLVERGVVVAAASRYMHGGQQVGGPLLKKSISRLAGTSLGFIGRVGTKDATNSFKAYSRAFVEEVGITSDAGFEIGIELVAKARRRRLPVAEVPTIWLDRANGQSNFKMRQWIPKYLHWYFYALNPSKVTRQSPH